MLNSKSAFAGFHLLAYHKGQPLTDRPLQFLPDCIMAKV